VVSLVLFSALMMAEAGGTMPTKEE